MREAFENIEVQIITIESEDVIATSDFTNGNPGMFTERVSTGDENDFGGNVL